MGEPPHGISNQGRFNSTGVNMFYVTETIKGACNEMKKLIRKSKITNC